MINAPTRPCQSEGCVISGKGPSGTDDGIFMVNEKWMDRLAEEDRSSRGKLGIGQIKTNRVLFKQTLMAENALHVTALSLHILHKHK